MRSEKPKHHTFIWCAGFYVRRQLRRIEAAAEWIDAGDASIVAYRRGNVLVALNAGDHCVLLPTGSDDAGSDDRRLVVLYSSRSFIDPTSAPGPVTLQPGEAVIARLGDLAARH